MNDRERLIEIFQGAPFGGRVLDYWWYREQIAKVADYLIDTGVTVQKHGRWEFDSDGDPCCSVCRKYAGLLRIESGNYCPNCGAKMDGEADG